MQELATWMKQAESETAQPSDIIKVLNHCQKNLCRSLFAEETTDSVQKTFRSIWHFFLFAAAHSSNNVRVASYRATGAFLLKMMPYFPAEVVRTFSDVSMLTTIDLKSSAIIASSFAFISNIIAFPSLEKFLDSSPVYHNFAISDPIFSEHLASIIKNVGKVGLDWFRTLLHSFLALVATSSDRYLMRSIQAIVGHYPPELMRETLDFIREQENGTCYLRLIAFLLRSFKGIAQDMDLFHVAKLALAVLGNAEHEKVSDIDASLEILSCTSSSFRLRVTGIDSDHVNLVLTGQLMIPEVCECVFSIAPYKSRSSFYLLQLPIQYLTPNYETDGSVTMNAKFISMGLLVNRDPTVAQTLFEILDKFVAGKYDDIVSACIRAMSKCLPVLLVQCDQVQVMKMVKDIVFSPSPSCSHLCDVLRLIKAVPVERYMELFGADDRAKIIDILIDGCMSRSDKLSMKAKRALIRMAGKHCFESITIQLAKHLDHFDPERYTKILTVLCEILDTYSSFGSSHLRAVVCSVIESCQIYKDDLSVLSVLFDFLSHFDLQSFSDSVLRRCRVMALSVIFGGLMIVSGQAYHELVKPSSLQKAVKLIEEDIKTINLDVISEANLRYETCLRPCLVATRLLSAMGPKTLDKGAVVQLCTRLMPIFPLETAKLMDRYWSVLPEADKATLLECFGSRLTFIQDYEVSAILCELFAKSCEECREKLNSTKVSLANIARFAIAHQLFTTERQLIVFRVFLFFIEKRSFSLNRDDEEHLKQQSPSLYSVVFGRKVEVTKQIVTSSTDCGLPKDINITPIDATLLSTVRKPGDPILKAQLRQATFEFDKSALQNIFKYYCDTEDNVGIMALLRYATMKKITISIGQNVIPVNSVSVILLYLKGVNSPELLPLAEKYLTRYSVKEVACAAVAADPAKFLNNLMNGKLSKTQLRNLAITSLSVNFNREKLQETVLNCFQGCKSKKKLNLLLATAANIFAVVKAPSEELVKFVLKVCSEKGEELSPMTVAMCLHNLAPLVQSDRDIRHLEAFLLTFPTISPMTAALELALAKTDYGKHIFERDASKLVCEFLGKKRPSMFCAGLKMFARGFMLFPEKKVQSLMKHCFNKLIHNYPNYFDSFGVAESGATLWMLLLSMPYLKKYYASVLANADKIIPMPSQAAFASVCLCIPQIIDLTNESKSLADVKKSMMARVNGLLTQPTSVFMSKIYLRVVAILAEKESNVREREKYVMSLAKKWLESGLAQRDSYRIDDIVYEWCATLLRYNGIDQLLPILTDELFRHCNRFFPVFVGAARFLSKYTYQGGDQLEQVKQALLNAATAMEKRCRVHAMALKLMAGRTMKLALDLARYDMDCPESDRLIQTLTQPVKSGDTLNEIMDLDLTIPEKSPPVTTFALIPDANAGNSSDWFEPISRVSSPGSSDMFELITPRGSRASDSLFERIPGSESLSDQFELIPRSEPNEDHPLIDNDPANAPPLIDLSGDDEVKPAQLTPVTQRPRGYTSDSLLDF